MTEPCDVLQRLRVADRRTGAKLANVLKHAVGTDQKAIEPCRSLLLRTAEEHTDLRVRWNLLATLAMLEWRGAQRARVLALAWSLLDAADPFTRVHALELLFQLAGRDKTLQHQLLPVLDNFGSQGTVSMQARARSVRRRLSHLSQ